MDDMTRKKRRLEKFDWIGFEGEKGKRTELDLRVNRNENASRVIWYLELPTSNPAHCPSAPFCHDDVLQEVKFGHGTDRGGSDPKARLPKLSDLISSLSAKHRLFLLPLMLPYKQLKPFPHAATSNSTPGRCQGMLTANYC